MNIQLKESERVTQLLNNWYSEIRKRNIEKSRELKSEIETYIYNVDRNQHLALHYALLEFRYQYLIGHLSIGKDSFDKIEVFEQPTDKLLSYYYHFFKAMYLTVTGDYNLAKNQYDKAGEKLKLIPDELEHAEFYYKVATFYCHNQQYVLALQEVSKAKEIFNKHNGYELNIGYCNNLYGLVCIHLKEYELAEEQLVSALDIFKKHGDDHACLFSRHNLGFLYGSQNLSELALRHISEVTTDSPNNYRALLIEACELAKTGNKNKALEVFEKGLTISKNLKNKEYQHHFYILKGIHENLPGEELEKLIIPGNEFFMKENLHEYIQEYNEKLAIKYYDEDNHIKASKYFYLSSKANGITKEKVGLK
ncbi:response regulator aspartate phosphatase [Bacillus bingmayongensis]|uniref:response regulator aspartate phosphatase n=1 Tax=Bacillus bingmayongensis TaxID=1150157 RepID=UPI001C8D4C7F|nr:tetratricopeptide repeat protein [Bacillus bingmayongensis]MBY0599256.1 tetratricopeptide repeat protein [Bacillus bingmayongensis]